MFDRCRLLIRLVFDADDPPRSGRIAAAERNRDWVARGDVFNLGWHGIGQPGASDIDWPIDGNAGPTGDWFGEQLLHGAYCLHFRA